MENMIDGVTIMMQTRNMQIDGESDSLEKWKTQQQLGYFDPTFEEKKKRYT